LPELAITVIFAGPTASVATGRHGVRPLHEDGAGNALQEAILASVVRSSLDCVIITDEAGSVVEFNPAAEATFGYSRADVVGRQVLELILPPRLRTAHAGGLAAYFSGSASQLLGRRTEQIAMRANGDEFPVELTMTDAHSGQRRFFTASLRDLSQRRAADAALRASEARLAAFMKHAPIGMYLKDTDGRYLVANPEMGKVFGRPAEDAIGLSAADIFGPEEAAMIAENDRRVLESGQAIAVEEFLSSAIDYAWSLVVRFPVLWADQQQARIGGFDIDITEQKRNAERLQQSERLNALGSLLAGVSHELNNPLAVVVAQTQLLEEFLAGTAHAQRASKIRLAAARCARIVKTFLAMARQRQPERRSTDINELIQAVLDIAAYGLRTAGVEVRCRFAEGLPSLEVDPDQMHQVFYNLIVNAQHALQETSAPRIIEIETSREGNDVQVVIADNGPGVPAEIRNSIFDPFFTTKALGDGTGIGLSFSLGVVQAHNGRLSLLDRADGAHFQLLLPVHSRTVPDPTEGVAAFPVVGTGRTALVVDDEREVGETMAELLEIEGFDVKIVEDGASAKAALRSAAFDAIFCDLRMPNTDGPALFDWARQAVPGLAERFIFVTGDTLGGAAARFLERAGRPVIEKPFSRDSLLRALENGPD
jgi:PAS domain S-box-containing protein